MPHTSTLTMAPRFLHAHATHPQADLALSLVWAQLESQGAATMGATLGWCYLTDALAPQAEAILHGLRERLPGVAWVGGVGMGVLASGVEYIDEPALAVMVSTLPSEDFRVYSGQQPLPALPRVGLTALSMSSGVGFVPHVAQVHADAHTPDLQELITELAGRTRTGYLFGGLSTGRTRSVHLALDPLAEHGEQAQGVWSGGVSGVAFSDRVHLVSRVTQGCQPIGQARQITAAERNVVYELDGEPALSCLLRDLNLTASVTANGLPREALPKVRATLVGLTDAASDLLEHRNSFGADTRVRHLVGLDPQRQGVAVSDLVEVGMQLAFCQRNVTAARRDLVRACAEIREEFDPQDGPSRTPAGAIYISCAGRGGPHFGGPDAEMQIIRHALGDIPLVGMFAGGEIARHHLYGYTGVLTVWA
ncbi:MAG: FIST C-terminal domain-containing protein [Aquabacterium sp.]|uniref:FIST signal transduction protein n=1 Tax=Aquabacterium sp. TaxID=1872578 RepID=UPI002725B65B|nr:FIST N-terminal domain-containing protein [Aquabacterium sp.]MDO9004294.1 FIST C-terminal domain-containing protein [Aquabacterium sp.]